ncbi:MAG: LacI family DNA-binding transcriptional regulator [Eubacteriales bacterium]|nr:LacI family DNA-binding transcriptional regulator [Eubacteriales bacterium]
MAQHVNIYTIAKEAGVSTATVSRVVSNHPSVRPETRRKVLEIVEKNGYHPNQIAAGLLKKKTHTIGVVFPSLENPFYGAICSTAQQYAQQMNYFVQLLPSMRRGGYDSTLVELLLGKRLDGVVLSGDVMPREPENARRMLRQLQKYMPVVVLNPPDDQLECAGLVLDLWGGMQSSVQHLYTLGHRRIAMLGGSVGANEASSRESAYLQSMRELALRPFPLVQADGCAEGENALLQLLSNCDAEQRPTAIVAFNDLVALGAMRQLSRLGLKVPDDMAVIGCDNQFFGPFLTPSLTTCDLHVNDAIQYAVRLLIQSEGELIPSMRRKYESVLMIRESCGAQLGKRNFCQ